MGWEGKPGSAPSKANVSCTGRTAISSISAHGLASCMACAADGGISWLFTGMTTSASDGQYPLRQAELVVGKEGSERHRQGLRAPGGIDHRDLLGRLVEAVHDHVVQRAAIELDHRA